MKQQSPDVYSRQLPLFRDHQVLITTSRVRPAFLAYHVYDLTVGA